MVQADTTTIPPLGHIPLDASAGQLVLQIRGRSRDGQIVRLESRKCTVGSGRSCTLRLAARGVQPLHCLILRGSHATIVRRWNPDTRLNGHAFSDAPLSAGDRLTIGPIELEVLQTTVSPSPTQSTQTTKNQHFLDLRKLAMRLELARRLGHRRARALVEQLRDARREIAQIKDPQCDEYQQREEMLTRRAGEMEAREAQLAGDRQALQEQRRQYEDQRSQLDSQREALERDRQTWEAQSGESQTERSQLDALRHEFDEQQAQWDAARREQEQESAQRWEDLDIRERALEDLQKEWEDRHSLRETEREEAGTAESGRSSESAPVDAGEILGRLGAVPLVPDDEPESPRSAEVESVAASPEEPAPAKDEDDESIHEYMARLMQRVRSVAQEPVAPGPRRESEQPAASEPETPPPHQGPVDLPPRRSAPENVERLSAMRELASASAHSAIDLHARTKHRESIREKLLFTITALVCGVGLIGAWAEFGASNVSYYVGLISLLAGVVWALRYATLSGWIKIGQFGGLKWRSAKATNQARIEQPAEADHETSAADAPRPAKPDRE